MPGIKLVTSTLAGPKNSAAAPSGRGFIVGITERGTLTPAAVRSIVEYQREFGGLTSFSGHMYRAAQTFFEEGGAELVVARAVGTTPTLATVTVVDRTAVTPLSTMRLDAANPGAWGASLTYQVTAGAVANSVNLAVFLNGSRVSYVTNKTTVADIVTALSADPYVRAADLGAASTYPTRLPAVGGPTPLTGGNDDRATVNAAKIVTVANGIGVSYGPGAIAAPGYNATLVGAGLIAHAKANRRVAVLAGDVTSVPSDLVTMAAALVTDGQYGGIYGPWLVVPDGSGTAQVSPEGFVLGVRGRVMNLSGFWQAAAGGRTAARYVLGPVTTWDATVIDTLADGRVNGITVVAGDTQVYGWRSMTALIDQFNLLNAQDVMNTLGGLVEDTLQQYVFDTIDGTGQLVARVKGALIGVLQPIADAGGFTGKYDADNNLVSPPYRVEVSVSGETSLAATVTVRLSGVAEEIQVSLVKAAYNATI